MYSTLMVYLEPGLDPAPLLQVAGDLAERFDAAVIGVAASQPIKLVYGDDALSGDIIEMDLAEIQQATAVLKEKFHAALQARASHLEWRSRISADHPVDYLACQARSADLVIANIDRHAAFIDDSRRVNTSDLVMQAGRPVLVVPPGLDALAARHVLVGWKDTREARRAVLDAVPFLAAATRVVVAEIVDGAVAGDAAAGVRDVEHWLRRHGVQAESRILPAEGDGARQLVAAARGEGADLIVSGAYGHSRLREWVLGGVTRNLLQSAATCTLMSH